MFHQRSFKIVFFFLKNEVYLALFFFLSLQGLLGKQNLLILDYGSCSLQIKIVKMGLYNSIKLHLIKGKLTVRCGYFDYLPELCYFPAGPDQVSWR